MLYYLWIKRVLFSSHNVFKSSSLLSLLSLVLACTLLTVALFVVNGFSLSLQKSLIDMNGQISIVSSKALAQKNFLKPIRPYRSHIQRKAPFLSFEGLLLQSQQFRGVMFEGISFGSFPSFLKKRILQGNLSAGEKGLVVGRALAQEWNLKVGTPLQVIVPSKDSEFKRRNQKLPLLAIMDFGRYDLNSRYVLMPLSLGQKLSGQTRKISGVRLWLKKESQINTLIPQIRNQISPSQQAFSWRELERVFFKMIEMDKKIIFFVLFLLIIVAGFNVSSSLFVSVFKKTKEISILKAMGASPHFLFFLFLLQGLVIGGLGILIGISLGVGIFFSLIEMQKRWHFIPEEIYKVNPIYVEWNYGDLSLLAFTTLFVVLVASFLPARRAYRLDVKSGLEYE